MKNYFSKLTLSIFTIIILSVSCKNDAIIPATPTGGREMDILLPDNTSTEVRKVQFSLYTDKDFSNYDGNITFSFVIRNLKTRAKWDSVLAPMKVKDIPSLKQKIFIEKSIPKDDKSLMTVGIIYHLENVGISWKTDTLNGETKLKKLNLNFQ